MKTLRHDVLGFLLYALCSGCVKSDDPRCHDTSGEPGFMTAHPERAHILQDHPCPITTWTKTFTPRNHYSESQHTNGAEHNPEQSSRSVTLLGYGREIFELMAALKYKGTKKDIKVSFILYKNGKFKFEDCFYTDADLLQRELECHRVYFHLNQMNYDQQHSNDHWCYNKLIMIPNRKESEMIDKADALNLHLNSFENSYDDKHKFRTRDDKLDNEERRIKGVLERNKLLSTKVKYNDLHDHYEAHAPQERHMICAPIHLKMSTFKKQQNENDFHTPAYQYIRPSEVMNTEHIKRAEDHIPAETNLFNNYLEDKSHSNQNFINYSNVQNFGNPLISRSRHSNVLYANSDNLKRKFKTASKSNSHIYYHAKPINYHSNEITIPKYKKFLTNPAYYDISKPQSNVHHLGKGIDYVSLPINLNTDRYFKQLNILNRNPICSQSRHSNELYANIESINTNFKTASKSNSHIYHYHTKPINYHGYGITIPKHENFVRNPGYTNHNNIGKPQTNIHHVGKRTDYVSLPINLNAARHVNQFIILNRNPISSQSNELYANNESINIKTASNSNRHIHHFHEKPINYQSYGITIPRLQATHFNYDKTKQAVPKYDNFITNPAYTNHISKPQSNIHHVGKGINYVSLPINLNTGRYFKQLNILNRNPVSRQSQQSNQLYANNISLNTNFKTDSNSNRHIYHAYQAKPINYHSHGITIPKYENFVTNLAYSNHNNIGKPQTNIHHLGKRIEYVSLPINLDTAKYFNLLHKSPGHKEFDFTNLNKHSDLSKFTMNNENMIVTDPFMYNTLVSTNLKKESYPLQNIYPGVDNSSNYQHFNQNIYSQTLHYVPNVEKTIVTMPDSCYYKNYVTVESNDNKWKEKTSSDTYPSNGNYYFRHSIKIKFDNYSSSQNPSIMSYAKHVQPNVYLNRLSTNIRKPKVATAITKNPAPEFQNNIPRPWSHNYLSHYISNNASSNKNYKRGPYINTFQRNDLDEQKDQLMTYFFAFKGLNSDFRPIFLPIYLSKLSKGANIPKVSQQNIQYLTHDLYNKPLKAEVNKNDNFIHLQVYLNNIYDQNQLSNVPFVRNLHSKPALSFNFPQTNYASKSIDDVKNKIIKQAISLKSPQMPLTNLKLTPAPFKYEYSSVNYKNHYNLNWSAVPLKVKHSMSPFFTYTPILKTQPIPNDLTQRHEYIHMKPENPQKALTSIYAKTEPTNYWIPRTHYYPNKNYNTASLEIHTAPEYKPSRIEDPVKPTNCITKPIIWQPGVGSEKTLNKCFQKAIPVMYISPNNILCKDDNKIEVQAKLISPVKSTSYITKPAFWQPEYISKIRSSPLYIKTPLFLTVKSITTTYKPTQSIKYNPNVSIKMKNPQKSKMLVCQNSINTKPINYWIPRQIITPNNYFQTARSETPKTPEHLPCKNDRIVKLKPKLVSPVKPTSYITKPIWQSEYPSEQVLSPIYVTKPSTHSLQPLKITNGVTPLINLSNINNKPTNYWKASNYITPYKYDRESKAEVQVSPVYKLNKTFYFVKEQPKTFRQLQYRSYKPSLSIYFKKPSTIYRHQPSTIKNKPFNYWIPRQYITPNNNYQTATTETYITPDYEPCKIDYKIIVHPDSVPSVKSINYNTKSKISQSKYPSKMPSSSMHLQKPLTPTGTLLLPTLTTNGSTQSYKYSPIKLEFSQKSTTPICLNNVNTKPANFWTSRKYVTANIPYQKSRLRIPIPRDFKPSKTFHNIRIQNGLVALGKSTSYKSVPAICQTKYTSEEPLTKTHVNKPLSLTLQPKTINNLSHNLVYGPVESVSPQKATTHISPSDVERKPVKYRTPRKYIKPDDYYQTASLIETHIRSDNKPCKNDHKIKVHPKLVSTVKPSNYIIKPAVWKSKYPIEQALPPIYLKKPLHLCLQPKTTKNRPNQSFEYILQSPHKTVTQISKAKPSKETKPVNFWGPRKYVSSKKYYQKPRPEILDPQDLNTNKTFHDITTQPGLVSLGKSTSYTTDPTIFQTKYPSEEPLSKKYFNKPLSHTLQPKTIIKDPTQRFIYSTVESPQKATTPICQNNINTIPVKYIPRKYITPNIYYQVARPKIQVALDYMPYKTYNNVQPKTIISSKLTSYSTEPTISQLKYPTEKPKTTRFEIKPSYISLQTITTTNNKEKSFKDNPINSKSHQVTTPISPSKIKTEPSNYITPHKFYCPNNCYEKSKPEIYVTPDFILHKTSYNNLRIQSESPQKPASYTTKSVFWKSEYSEKPLLKKCSRKPLTPFLQATTTTTNDRIQDFEYSPIKWERSQKATTHLIPSNKPMNYWIPRINVVPNIQYRKSRPKLYVTPYKTYSNVHPKTITLNKLSSYCTEPAIIQLEHNSKELLSQKYSRKPLTPSPRPSTATNDTTRSLENNQINSKVNIKIKPVNYQTPNKYHEKVTKNIHVPPELKPCETFHDIKMQPRLVSKGKPIILFKTSGKSSLSSFPCQISISPTNYWHHHTSTPSVPEITIKYPHTALTPAYSATNNASKTVPSSYQSNMIVSPKHHSNLQSYAEKTKNIQSEFNKMPYTMAQKLIKPITHISQTNLNKFISLIRLTKNNLPNKLRLSNVPKVPNPVHPSRTYASPKNYWNQPKYIFTSKNNTRAPTAYNIQSPKLYEAGYSKLFASHRDLNNIKIKPIFESQDKSTKHISETTIIRPPETRKLPTLCTSLMFTKNYDLLILPSPIISNYYRSRLSLSPKSSYNKPIIVPVLKSPNKNKLDGTVASPLYYSQSIHKPVYIIQGTPKNRFSDEPVFGPSAKTNPKVPYNELTHQLTPKSNNYVPFVQHTNREPYDPNNEIKILQPFPFKGKSGAQPRYTITISPRNKNLISKSVDTPVLTSDPGIMQRTKPQSEFYLNSNINVNLQAPFRLTLQSFVTNVNDKYHNNKIVSKQQTENTYPTSLFYKTWIPDTVYKKTTIPFSTPSTYCAPDSYKIQTLPYSIEKDKTFVTQSTQSKLRSPNAVLTFPKLYANSAYIKPKAEYSAESNFMQNSLHLKTANNVNIKNIYTARRGSVKINEASSSLIENPSIAETTKVKYTFSPTSILTFAKKNNAKRANMEPKAIYLAAASVEQNPVTPKTVHNQLYKTIGGAKINQKSALFFIKSPSAAESTKSKLKYICSPSALFISPKKLNIKSANMKPIVEYSTAASITQNSLYRKIANNVNLKHLYTTTGNAKINQSDINYQPKCVSQLNYSLNKNQIKPDKTGNMYARYQVDRRSAKNYDSYYTFQQKMYPNSKHTNLFSYPSKMNSNLKQLHQIPKIKWYEPQTAKIAAHLHKLPCTSNLLTRFKQSDSRVQMYGPENSFHAHSNKSSSIVNYFGTNVLVNRQSVQTPLSQANTQMISSQGRLFSKTPHILIQKPAYSNSLNNFAFYSQPNINFHKHSGYQKGDVTFKASTTKTNNYDSLSHLKSGDAHVQAPTISTFINGQARLSKSMYHIPGSESHTKPTPLSKLATTNITPLLINKFKAKQVANGMQYLMPKLFYSDVAEKYQKPNQPYDHTHDIGKLTSFVAPGEITSLNTKTTYINPNSIIISKPKTIKYDTFTKTPTFYKQNSVMTKPGNIIRYTGLAKLKGDTIYTKNFKAFAFPGKVNTNTATVTVTNNQNSYNPASNIYKMSVSPFANSKVVYDAEGSLLSKRPTVSVKRVFQNNPWSIQSHNGVSSYFTSSLELNNSPGMLTTTRTAYNVQRSSDRRQKIPSPLLYSISNGLTSHYKPNYCIGKQNSNQLLNLLANNTASVSSKKTIVDQFSNFQSKIKPAIYSTCTKSNKILNIYQQPGNAFYLKSSYHLPESIDISQNRINSNVNKPENINVDQTLANQIKRKLLESGVMNNLFNINQIDSIKLYNGKFPKNEIAIQLGNIGMAKCMSTTNDHQFTLTTDDPNIEIKAWKSKLRLIKAKLVLDLEDFTVTNFVPIVKNNHQYDINLVEDKAKEMITKEYGEPLLHGFVINTKPYAFISDVNYDDLVSGKCNILWPACDPNYCRYS